MSLEIKKGIYLATLGTAKVAGASVMGYYLMKFNITDFPQVMLYIFPVALAWNGVDDLTDAGRIPMNNKKKDESDIVLEKKEKTEKKD